MIKRIYVALTVAAVSAGLAVADPTKIANFSEDSVHASGDNGRMCLAVRNDTLAALAGTDGDYAPIQVDATGAVYVTTAGGDGPVGYAEDAAETAAAVLSMCGSVRRDTAASSAGTTGDNATINTDATGRLWVTGTDLEDVAETDGGQVILAGSVRRDTAASSAGTTGDYATINTDDVGALWVTQVGEGSITCGHTDVPTAGTAVQLGSNSCREVHVSCGSENTGTECFVASAAGDGRSTGMAISDTAGPAVFRINNTNLLYVDVSTSGDDVGWCCVN